MAYLTFDTITLRPTGVQWNATADSAIEISKEEALEFIEGTRSLLEYLVVATADGHKLAKVEISFPATAFWTLMPISSASDVEFSVTKNAITVKFLRPLAPPVMLFATVRDDPTWLVESWNLALIEPDRKGRRRVNLNGAKNHDFYMSKVHEDQAR